jgi:formylglycine-generating enzyme required for sulfatase activity
MESSRLSWVANSLISVVMLLAGTAKGGPLPANNPVFYRFVSPATAQMTALSAQGLVTWSNTAVGVTGQFQRAIALADATAFVDYVQSVVTNPVMSLRLFDPSPPPGMALIPAGTNVGTDPDFGDYRLTLTEFYMDCTHVTKVLWDLVRSWGITNGYADLPMGGAYGRDYPVFNISWHEAVKWCNARSEREGRPVAYRVGGDTYRTGRVDTVACDFAVCGYRLPTLREWEYAARGGLRGKRYPWGDDIGLTKLNFAGVVDHTTLAGTYPPNGFDLYDMAGNLWQWIWDWHPDHLNRYRAIRGGSWSDQYFACRCAAGDFFHNPLGSDYLLGFRTVRP